MSSMDFTELTGIWRARSPKTVLDGPGLHLVVELRGGAVGVDVVHLVRGNARPLQGGLHRLGGALPVLQGLCDVEGVSARPVADDFGQDGGPALAGELQVLQDEDASPLADDKTVAPGVEGAGGLLGASFREEIAFRALKAAIPMGLTMASAPPVRAA